MSRRREPASASACGQPTARPSTSGCNNRPLSEVVSPSAAPFYAQAAKVSGMVFIAANRDGSTGFNAGDNSAADAAVWTGGSGFAHQLASARSSNARLPTHTLPCSIFTGHARTDGSPLSYKRPSRKRIRCLYSGEITIGSPPASPKNAAR